MRLEERVITGLATSNDVVILTIKDLNLNKVSSLFECIASKNISVDMISQTAPIDDIVNVSFTISKEDLNECNQLVQRYADDKDIVIDNKVTKVSLVGLGMKNTAGVASKVFKIFKDNNIKVKLITTSEIRISCAINSSDEEVAINEVAKVFNI